MRAEDHDRNLQFPYSFGGSDVRPFGSRVRIVGGGLTGILAAFQAHRMGARNIELYERLGRLGGIALPDVVDGREMREGCIYFGPEGDPIRSLLEAHGARFEEFDNRFGSVSGSLCDPACLTDFGGPALASAQTELSPLEGRSLGDRLSCYDAQLSGPLEEYVRWHVGCEPSDLHANAAIPLAINRVFPKDADLDALSASKQGNALADELFGIPRAMWGYTSNAKASLPVGGFTALFRQCREALDAIGVRIHERSLARPKEMLGQDFPGDVLVWGASPMPLFKAVDLDPPRAPARKFATYVFAAQWDGPVPFYVQNFTAEGSVFRAYLYESAGSVLLAAECVEQVDEATLQRELHQLLEPFGTGLALGKLQHRKIAPRWLYHSVDTIDKLGALRSALQARMGSRFVTGAWEAYAKGEKFVEVERDLGRALEMQMVAGTP